MDVSKRDPCGVCGSDQHRSREHDAGVERARWCTPSRYERHLSYSPLTIGGVFGGPQSVFIRYRDGTWRVERPETLRFIPSGWYESAPADPEARHLVFANRDEEFFET